MDDGFVGFVIGCLIGGTFMGCVVVGCTKDVDQSAAINAGVAKWTINETSGEKKFEYLRPTSTAVSK